jgi:hypothetical protein
VFRYVFEVLVGCQQPETIPNAQLSNHSVDGTDLDSLAAATVSQGGGFDVILDIWGNHREQREGVDDPISRLRTLESLKQFLQHQTRRYDDVAAIERNFEPLNFGARARVSPQGE